MQHALQDKLIRRTNDDIENTISLAIRRAGAAGDQGSLLTLATQVRALADTAIKGADRGLTGAVKRLHQELIAAAAGEAPPRPLLEYKTAAVALSYPNGRTNHRKAASGAMAVTGYGSTFGGPPDAYGDVIQAGAFRDSLAKYRAAGTLPKMFFSHDPAQIAGKWLSMSEDATGLAVAGQLADTALGRDLNTLVEMGALDALSIGFFIPKGGASFDSNGLRVIKQLELMEVSLVAMPANPRAQLNGAPAVPSTDSLDDSLAHLGRLIDHDPDDDNNVLPFPSRYAADESLADTAARVLASLKR